jgi:uncharacterized protein (TIGR03435 family)
MSPTPMGEFTSLLQTAVLDKPVVDQTGLTEKYDFVVKFTPDPGMMQGLCGGGPAPANNRAAGGTASEICPRLARMRR